MGSSEDLQSSNMEEVIKYLIKMGAKVDTKDHKGRTALMIALEEGCSDEAVQLLLDASEDIFLRNDEGKSALVWAAEGGRLKILNSMTNIARRLGKEVIVVVLREKQKSKPCPCQIGNNGKSVPPPTDKHPQSAFAMPRHKDTQGPGSVGEAPTKDLTGKEKEEEEEEAK